MNTATPPTAQTLRRFTEAGELLQRARLLEPERIGHAEAFFAALGADIRHGGNRALNQHLYHQGPFRVRQGL